MSEEQPVVPVPSQVAHPSKAVLRTVVQTVVTLAAVIPLVVEVIGDDSPVWLVPILTGAVVLAGVVTRIMAIPMVNGWLTSVGLGATPSTGRHQAP
jgi:uncharacterized membrane protein